MKKRLPMSVWKEAVVKAKRERRRFLRAVKIRSIVCVESLTA